MATFETAGTQLLVANVESPQSPPDYIAFCVTSIDPVGFSRSLIDVTTLCSVAREYKLALADGQEINIEAFYDPGNGVQADLRRALKNGQERDCKIILADGSPATEIDFAALVMNWSIGAQLDGVYPLRVTLKPTGDIVWSNE